MTDAFGIEPLASEVTLDEDTPSARVEVDVSNGLGRHVEAGVEVRAEEPLDPGWVTVEAESVALEAGDSRRIGVRIAPPPEARPREYRFALRVYDVERPADKFATSPPIAVTLRRAEADGGPPPWLLPLLGAVLLLVLGLVAWRLVAGDGDPAVVDPPTPVPQEPTDEPDDPGDEPADGLTGVVTAVGSRTAAAGSFGAARVHCPPGMVALGGGADPANVLTMGLSSSAPVFGTGDGDRLLSLDDGEHPAPIGWQASVQNTTEDTREFRVAVVCAPADQVSATAIVRSGSATAGSFGSARVRCPSGTVALGGGVDPANVLTLDMSSSGPVFGTGEGVRLVTLDDGEHPAPIGWQVSIRNPTEETREFRAAVVCAGAEHVAVTVVGSGSAGGGSFGTARPLCPSGTVALGGGVDPSNVLTLGMSSSAAAFGAENADRLVFRDAGEHPAPAGWQVSIRNPTVDAGTFRAAVVCGPG